MAAVVQISQGTTRTKPAVAGTFRVRVMDATDTDVVAETMAVGASAFAGRVSQQTVGVPVQDMVPGRYLLRIAAAAGPLLVERSVRFEAR